MADDKNGLVATFEMLVTRLSNVETMLSDMRASIDDSFEFSDAGTRVVKRNRKSKIVFHKDFVDHLRLTDLKTILMYAEGIGPSDSRCRAVRGDMWDDAWKYVEEGHDDPWNAIVCHERFPWLRHSRHRQMMSAIAEEACVRVVPECIGVGGYYFLLKASDRTRCLEGLTRILEELNSGDELGDIDVYVIDGGTMAKELLRFERGHDSYDPERSYRDEVALWSRSSAKYFVNNYFTKDNLPDWIIDEHRLTYNSRTERYQ